MGYSHGTKWTEEMIIKEIKKVMLALGITDRFPSNSELISITRNTSLSNKISKMGGFYKWANRMGLSIKKSETKLGIEYEIKAIEYIKKLRFKNVIKTRLKHPFDILVEDKVKIDVKVAKRYSYAQTGSYYHSFNLDYTIHSCDLFILYALDDSENIEKVFIVPSMSLNGKKQISVGKKTKYDKYRDRWDLIQIFIEKFEQIETIFEHNYL